MVTENPDDLVQFEDVRVISSTAQAVLCRIGEKSVWLPRWHISGKLWCTGDRGKLFVRRWVAHDRNLIDVQKAVTPSPIPALSRPPALHGVRGDRDAAHAEYGQVSRFGVISGDSSATTPGEARLPDARGLLR
jgi:hypothetical protein